MSEKRRVVVTGLGTVTPVGNNVASTWESILASRSGVTLVDAFDTSQIASKISASVKDFDPSAIINSKEARKMDIFIQYGLVAAEEAIKDAGLDANISDPNRIGVAIGSGIGGLPAIEAAKEAEMKAGARRISPFLIPSCIINMISGHVSIRHGFQGPNFAIVTACTTGTHNLGYAARTIAYGDADVMVAGGSEMATSMLGLGGFSNMRALSTRNDAPETASRPWDRDRDGFVLADGAGVLILEEYEHAKKRGTKIYAELLGFGLSADAFHMTLPDDQARGFSNSMEGALKDAGLTAEQVDYVNAHGTSTPAGDPLEIKAVKQTFGDHAQKIAMSSTKSMVGHLIAAAGSVEAIFSVLAIRDNVAPPTINLDNPEEGCGDINLVPHEAQQSEINIVLSNSFGFGGTNGTLIFGRV